MLAIEDAVIEYLLWLAGLVGSLSVSLDTKIMMFSILAAASFGVNTAASVVILQLLGACMFGTVCNLIERWVKK